MKEPLSERLMTPTPVNTELFVKEVQVAQWVHNEVKRLEEQNSKMLELLKTLVSIFDPDKWFYPDKQTMYNFAHPYIKIAKEMIANAEGER